MIINIRGTSGTGKTTVVRKVMSLLSKNEIEAQYALSRLGRVMRERRRKPLYYFDKENCVAYLGHYEGGDCGGCDTISPYSLLLEALSEAHSNGYHVIMEGLLLSEDVKQCLSFPPFVEEARVIFLATDVETAIASVRRRRAKAGNTKPFNEENTRGRVRRIESARRRLEEAGVYCRTLSRSQAPGKILQWLGVKPCWNKQKRSLVNPYTSG